MPIPRGTGKHGRPKWNQAAKIIARFNGGEGKGGENRIADLLKISRVTVYRWQMRSPYGTDGLIPTKQINRLKEIARYEGVLIRQEDWVPERIHYPEPTLQELLS